MKATKMTFLMVAAVGAVATAAVSIYRRRRFRQRVTTPANESNESKKDWDIPVQLVDDEVVNAKFGSGDLDGEEASEHTES